MNITLLEEVDSTNNFLRSLLQKEEVEEGKIVLAHKQTQGKGQRGNSWFSSPEKNLTFSILLSPSKLPPVENFLLSQCVAVGIVEGLSVYVPNLSIKWSNDIYWKNKKLGGILIENSFRESLWEHSIVGIGLNIFEENFPPDLPNPVSLFQISQKEYSLEEILEVVFQSIMKNYNLLLSGGKERIQEKYLQYLYQKGISSEYEAEGRKFFGTIQGVEPSGKLRMEKENGEIALYDFKEVKFITNSRE
ncbi:MAG TPA: biotin--[acetyl-CoA-carboxylase] ligase [Porphyromonadaceae bacterium]|nr:biotin--[acetyl-CoA-carboxylase] ligase [Porphyromonadaceae bacterium]